MGMCVLVHVCMCTSMCTEAAIKTTTFAHLFASASCTNEGTCSDSSFRPTNTGKGCECLKPVAGMERLAAVLEKRRYAGMCQHA